MVGGVVGFDPKTSSTFGGSSCLTGGSTLVCESDGLWSGVVGLVTSGLFATSGWTVSVFGGSTGVCVTGGTAGGVESCFTGGTTGVELGGAASIMIELPESQHGGAGSQQTGAGSQQTGAGWQHTGAGSQQTTWPQFDA